MAIISIPEYLESVDPEYIREVLEELEPKLLDSYKEFFRMLIDGEIKFILPSSFYRIKAKNVGKKLMRRIGSVQQDSLVYCGPYKNYDKNVESPRRFYISLPRVAYMIFTMEYPEGKVCLRDTSNLYDLRLENLFVIKYEKTPSPPVRGDDNYVDLDKIRRKNSRFRTIPAAPTYLNVGQPSDSRYFAEKEPRRKSNEEEGEVNI